MKSLQDYILGLKKDYKFRIRTLFDISEKQVQMIEEFLEKYDIINATSPKKTMFVKHPIGFEEPVSSEVTFIDITLSLPASSFVLRNEIANLFDEPFNRVSVISEHEEDSQDDAPLTKPENDPLENVEKIDSSDFYGDEYNQEMIKKISSDRENIKQSIFKKQ